MSAGGSKSKSSQSQQATSQSPFLGQQTTLADILGPLLGQQAFNRPAFAGAGSQFAGQSDVLQALLGGGGAGTPLAGAGQTLQQLIETGAPTDTGAIRGAAEARRRRLQEEDFAQIRETATGQGTRFASTTNEQQLRSAERSRQDLEGILSPLEFQAGEAARGRQAGAIGGLGDLGLRQTGLGIERELGILPFALQFLSSGIATQQSSGKGKSSSKSAQAGI